MPHPKVILAIWREWRHENAIHFSETWAMWPVTIDGLRFQYVAELEGVVCGEFLVESKHGLVREP
jgi:hypothetical protein